MNDSDRLSQFVAIVQNMRAAQRDYHGKGKTTVVECKRLEAATDRWLEDQGFTKQQQLFSGETSNQRSVAGQRIPPGSEPKGEASAGRAL